LYYNGIILDITFYFFFDTNVISKKQRRIK